MKLKYMAILLTAATCTLTSCEDFLMELPENAYIMENAVTDYSSAKNIVNGIYGVHVNGTSLGGTLYGNLHCMAGFWDYTPAMEDMTYRQSSAPSSVSEIWKQLYSVVNAANAAITGIEGLADAKFPSIEEKNRLLAEAKCMRGYCNLQLLWYFGHWFAEDSSPYGIIYRDKASDLSNLMVGRSTVGESYKYIVDDLEYAEKYLGNYSSARYLSKQFAQAMHAKMLLVRGRKGDYESSLKLVDDILSSAPATFKMEANLSDLYNKGWDSKEVLFSRYLGDKPSFTQMEFIYSYGLYYNNEFADTPQEWLTADARSEVFFGTSRSPESWDGSTKKVLKKMYHRGRIEGVNDMYATYNFRYAELYLMKAELLARINPGNIQAAVDQINKMRSTYTSPKLEPLTGITTEAQFMDALFKEYVVTLFMENETPWFASLRINHEGKPWIKTLKPNTTFSQNHYCWPIPDEEIVAHLNPIEQNPDLK